MSNVKAAYLFAIFFFASTLPAHAYIDPATGTLIVQSILGAAAAAITICGVYLAKIRGGFWRLMGREEKTSSEDNPS